MAVRLSEEQIWRFAHEGFVRAGGPVFETADFQRLVALFEDKLAAWPADRRPEHMDMPHVTDHRLLEWALAPALLDLVEPLLGPDLLLFSTHCVCKPARTGMRFTWHDDASYWRGMLDSMQVVTVWLALDPATVDTGCMFFIPRQHTRDICETGDPRTAADARRRFLEDAMQSGRIRELPVVNELQANECSLHDPFVLHASAENASPSRRCAWAVRFMPANCLLRSRWRRKHPIYLARGRNLLNQALADPDRDYAAAGPGRVHGA